ncbi:MAG: RidA family protein [Mesorhizobium sp.]|uniref:RidA family protein n=1 Tax=Mesorhizobium sp. M00.F.Ca.ET.217.01.1.1 TaxID=2500529 RepID=UPI000FD91FD6|nr:RidA family protein [Mesorhizobium sp. M00.F.Ca.ET.217.01.1.1]TGQ13602.1 RidA family protein [Mesorhizobium sp. M00.F.Ca.ET.217.01.1.1]TGV85467.1 RidA family protein [Mesorhizobium sp. M00.F.Ca.ET.158.01.1.1]TKB29006.1 MAG: RidA family protein [Mesorhizobium sp.]
MNDDITHIESGPRYSQAVVHNGIVYLCGQVGSPNTSITEQTEVALANIDRLLALSGSDKSRILQVTIWLTDMKHWAEMTAAYEKWIPRGSVPARASVGSALVPNYDVEIMLTAAQRRTA